jgi:hypothetical protein
VCRIDRLRGLERLRDSSYAVNASGFVDGTAASKNVRSPALE